MATMSAQTNIPKCILDFEDRSFVEERKGNFQKALEICGNAKEVAKKTLTEKRNILSKYEMIALRFHYQVAQGRSELLASLMQLQEHCNNSEVAGDSRNLGLSGSPTVTASKAAAATPSGKHDDEQDEDDVILKKVMETLRFKVPVVKMDHVIGMSAAKDAIMQTLRLPLDFPGSTQAKNAWRGILLFGPSGVGKTLLIKAIAAACKISFLNIKLSDVLSKWQGQSVKILNAVFKVAKENSPAIIFIDECDSLCRARTAEEGESSAQIKTELLTQMDGFASLPGVTVIGNTNLPEVLDTAFLRRFQKRIYVGLPSMTERILLLRTFLREYKTNLSSEEYEMVAMKTNGYSGSDLFTLVIVAGLEQCKGLYAKPLSTQATAIRSLKLRPIVIADLDGALKKVPKTNDPKIVYKLERWNEANGDGASSANDNSNLQREWEENASCCLKTLACWMTFWDCNQYQ